MLINKAGRQVDHSGWSTPNPSLLMWKVGGEARSGEIPLPELQTHARELPTQFLREPPGQFTFAPGGENVVGLQPPWALLIDLPFAKETRRLLVCRPSVSSPEATEPAVVPRFAPRNMLLAVSPADGSLAIACNSKEMTLQIFNHDLQTKLVSWPQERPIQEIAWSRDGRLLAALYHMPPHPTSNASRGNPTATGPTPRLPNVIVYDVAQNRERLRFDTGDVDAKLAFDPAGTSLYSIARGGGSTGDRKELERDTLRRFDITTGRLVKRYVVKDTGVRQNFAVSPDGNLIAAGIAVTAYPPFFMEQVSIKIRAGFVLLDAETGRELGRDSRRTVGYTDDNLPLFFIGGGKYLLVGYEGSGRSDDYGELVTYSLSLP
jgi:hypothetical protein